MAKTKPLGVSCLQRSIVEMPEIAQRLSGTRDLREIPDRTLELVEEIFDPRYCLFYRVGRDDLVAVASRGECEFRVGHRVPHGGREFEVDVFLGENEGLVIAEVELESEDADVSLPSWVGREVTGDARFYNASLVARPFSRWRDEEG